MKVDDAGKPLVGTRRNTLGVRPTDPTSIDPKRRFDVAAVNDTDMVSPGEGLPTFLAPDKLRVGRNEALFVIDTDDLPAGLAANPDHPRHSLIEPSSPVSLATFQQALRDTRDLWKQIV
jgi:hypothetical protein